MCRLTGEESLPVATVLLSARWLLLGASEEPAWWPLKLKCRGLSVVKKSSDRLIKKVFFLTPAHLLSEHNLTETLAFQFHYTINSSR